MSQVFKTNIANSQTDNNAKLWTIDENTMFHPLGMRNISSETKTVILVWDEDYLLNFVIKQHEQTTIKKVRILMPDGEVIKDVLLLDLNTLLLMQSGSIYYFSSAKSVHIIPWLSGVQSISKAAQVGFSVLRLQLIDANVQLVLEIYREAVNMAIGHDNSTSPSPQMVHSFKISTPEFNLFNSCWADESFKLLSVEVNNENKNFFVQTIGCEEDDLYEEQILHFFSVSSDIYVLISNKNCDDEFTMQLMNRYSSEVVEIKIMPILQMCCTFLKCGTIDILYISRVSRFLKRFTKCLESPLLSYDFFPDNSHIMYYASERNVFELNFTYNCHLDLINIKEHRKSVPGILACTWVPRIQQLVCLSWNNVFYQIAFEKCGNDEEPGVASSSNKMCVDQTKLVSFKMDKITEKANFINDLTQLNISLKKKLKVENMKKQLLAFTNNCLQKKYFKAIVEFHHQLPNIENITYYVQNNSQMRHKSIYALIKLNLLIETDVFKSMAESWNLLMDFNGNSYFITNKKLSNQQVLCVELNVQHEQDFHSILEQFTLRLLNFITDDESPIFLELPIDLEISQKNFIKEFCTMKMNQIVCQYKCEKLLNLYKTPKKNNELTENDSFNIHYELKISENAFQYLCSTFKNWVNEITGNPIISTPKVNMAYNKDSKCLTLNSYHPTAIYFIKTLLIIYANEAFGLQHNDLCAYNKINKTERESFIQQTLTMRSKLEQITFSTVDNNGDIQLFDIESLQLDLLQEMYNRLRKDLQVFSLMN